MDANRLLPFLATIIMFAFGGLVLQRYRQRRHLHNLFWGVGLLMFGVGTFAEAYLAVAWSALLFRSWYAFGAMLNAGWLGHGSLLLLARRKGMRYLTAALLILSLIGVIAVFTIPLNDAAYTPQRAISEQYKEILPAGASVRMMTPIFNIYGSVFLIGGAFYSAYLFWRKQASPQRVVGYILIAAGALVIASASTLTRLFFGGFLYVGELTAAVLMFTGFMLATSPAAMRAPSAQHMTRPAA